MAHDPLHHVLDQPLIESLGIYPSKYQALLVVAAAIVAGIYIPLARRIETGEAPRGKFWNFFESILTYIRNEVVRPNIHDPHDHGHETADRFVPFIWTVFLFILTCNLLGMIPGLGSPTANISVTAVLATFAFLVIHVSAVMKLGVGHYLLSYVPRLKTDSTVMNIFLWILIVPLITIIEVVSALIRAFVLAVRLFANIFAGHVALGVIILFVATAWQTSEWYVAGPVSVVTVIGSVLLSMLELFVAFLQAFVFTLLTTIFIGMALNPEH